MQFGKYTISTQIWPGFTFGFTYWDSDPVFGHHELIIHVAWIAFVAEWEN